MRTGPPAIKANGTTSGGAEGIDFTYLVALATWPTENHLVVGRERPHAGAQLSIFDHIEELRHTAQITNQTGDATVLELPHRQGGAAEDVIRDLKPGGMTTGPQ